MTAKTLRFFIIFVCFTQFLACRTQDKNDSKSSPAETSIVENPSNDRGQDESKKDTGKFSLTAKPVTSANACGSGDVACTRNGINLGCSADGRLGMCSSSSSSYSASTGFDCDCKTAPIPPDVAIGTCNTTSRDTVCNGQAFGNSCVKNSNSLTPGFCVPNDGNTSSCDCSTYSPNPPTTTVADQPKGVNCSTYNNQTSAPCINQKIGDACSFGSPASIGACIQKDANNACDCVASTLRPNLPDKVCNNTYSLDGCGNRQVGTLCLEPRLGVSGICAQANTNQSISNECSCVSTAFTYPDIEPTACSNNFNTENSPSCRNRDIGNQCAEDGLAGTCIITEGSNNNSICICATSAKLVPKEIKSPTGLRLVGSREAGQGMLSSEITWNKDPDDLTLGYKIAVGPAKLTCAGTADIGKVTTYNAPNQSPNTNYFVTLCGYSSTGAMTAPIFIEYLTTALPSAPLCGTFYTAVQYGGSGRNVQGPSTNIPLLADFDRSISSIKISPFCKMQLFSESNFGGTMFEVAADTPDLIPLNFNDLTRSVKCSCTPDTTIFADNFNRADSTNLGTNWTEFFGDLAIGGNQLKGNAPGWCGAANTTSATDVVVEADYTSVPNATGEFGVILRYAGPADTNMYNAQLDISRSYIRLFKNVNGAWSFLGDGSFTGQTSGRIKFTAVGNVLTVYINGVQILSKVDTSIPGAGRSGFRIDGTAVRIDNFRVSRP